MNDLYENVLSKVSNPKEREAVSKALGLINAKMTMQAMEARKQSSADDWEKKYQKLQEFNKGLMTRLKAEQDKSKSLEAEEENLHKMIQGKEKSIEEEKVRISSLEEEVKKLQKSQEVITQMEEEAVKLRQDIVAYESSLEKEKQSKEGLKSELETMQKKV